MSDTPTSDRIRQALREYMETSGVDVATLARQIQHQAPGALSVPAGALQQFLRGESEASDALLNICGRFLATIKLGE